ncbi:tripartite tricarboxylate transporter TctB family protein [Chloroflexus sp.]|uniref:tripartite tricarboxylate transporter TctB family protein n=1 Tax=Chloroflexus sp. TaxID=1904827 RepID=UPI00261E6222|nr:tripartite tricarboxylate transporter TctB family protein [uncultured Chloroflexus sp.]
MNAETRALLWLRLTALAVIGLGGVILTQTSQIGENLGYTIIGPRFFPTLVGIGFLILGGLLFLRLTMFPDQTLIDEVVAEERMIDWLMTATVLALLVVYAALLESLGYVLATTIFFALNSRVLGSRRLRRDVLIGFAIGIAVYLFFTRLLGVRLPAGLLSGLL